VHRKFKDIRVEFATNNLIHEKTSMLLKYETQNLGSRLPAVNFLAMSLASLSASSLASCRLTCQLSVRVPRNSTIRRCGTEANFPMKALEAFTLPKKGMPLPFTQHVKVERG
jgi:hypothetical protein